MVAASALADRDAMRRRWRPRPCGRRGPDLAEAYTLRLWYVKGDVLAKAGRRDEAATELRKIVRHDASAFDAAERLAELS